MLRAHLKRISLPTPRNLTRTGPSKRRYGSFIPGTPLPAVPVLRPTLWAFAATATIYIGCAAYDVRKDVQNAKKKGYFKDGTVGSYEDLEEARRRGHTRYSPARAPPRSQWHPPGQIGQMMAGYSDAERLILGAAALNIGLLGASYLAPTAFTQHFFHIPVLSPNYTLLTSAFGHGGLLHVGMNTLALLSFGPVVARSPTFEGNGSHFAAFYLSTAIFASLGDQFATILPTRKYRLNRFSASMGASGVIMAMMGASFTTYPDARIGIIFLPGSYPMQNVAAAVILFEMYGLFVGFPRWNLGHGAHLAGLAVGSAYVYFDGQKRLWRPARRFTFQCMKRLKAL
ncbi:hypothetical protein F5Y04DRAFT_242163 [Hypomontagnella monticulosa]|nr:hypothetical protein F5Y04DRAFT_242163 [Hypomontagnella monticulosa]